MGFNLDWSSEQELWTLRKAVWNLTQAKIGLDRDGWRPGVTRQNAFRISLSHSSIKREKKKFLSAVPSTRCLGQGATISAVFSLLGTSRRLIKSVCRLFIQGRQQSSPAQWFPLLQTWNQEVYNSFGLYSLVDVFEKNKTQTLLLYTSPSWNYRGLLDYQL